MFPKYSPIPKLSLLLCTRSDLPYFQPARTSLEFYTISPPSFSHNPGSRGSSLIWKHPRGHTPPPPRPKINTCLYVMHVRHTGNVIVWRHLNLCAPGGILIRPNVKGGTVVTYRRVAENRWRTEPSAWQLGVPWDVSERSCVLVCLFLVR